MNPKTTFSEDWHEFYGGFILRTHEGRHILNEIEDQLREYEAIWHNQPPFRSAEFRDIDPGSVAGRLAVASRNVELLERVILCRSIHLIRAFIEAINRDDFDSAPFLLRAVMEQAALGAHAVKRVREALAVFRREPGHQRPWEELLANAQLTTLFGAKVNFGAIVKMVQERLNRGEEVDYAVEEIEMVRELIEQGRFSEREIEQDDLPFKARNIIDLVKDLSAGNPQKGAPPNAIEGEWAYFSQYCHPSGFAWSFDLGEVFTGGRDYNASSEAVERRRKAFMTFVEPMWEWVLNLPGHVIGELAAVESELEREVDAVEGKA